MFDATGLDQSLPNPRRGGECRNKQSGFIPGWISLFWQNALFYISFMKSVISLLILWSSQLYSRGTPPPPPRDYLIVGRWAPSRLSIPLFVSSVSNVLFYYRLCCFTRLLSIRTPFLLRSNRFLQLSVISYS